MSGATLRNGKASTSDPPNSTSADGSWNPCIAPRHRPSVGSSIRDTVPTRATASLPRDSPRPPATPATQVVANRPTATTPDAIGETAVESSTARVSSTMVCAASNANAVTGSGGQ